MQTLKVPCKHQNHLIVISDQTTHPMTFEFSCIDCGYLEQVFYAIRTKDKKEFVILPKDYKNFAAEEAKHEIRFI